MRYLFNNRSEGGVESAALFMMLNKTGFRGMFREGPNGFNIPFGNYKKPTIITKSELDAVSELFRDVEFSCCDFSDCLSNVSDKSFVYLDPPYVPENTKSFVGYTKNGFSQHEQLFQFIDDFKSVRVMMSNACVPLVIEHFTTSKYNITEIECKRRINSKDPASKTMEVIITNY